jgi:hypothetical protein
MCDLSKLREMAQAGPTVTLDSKTLLELIDSVIVVTLDVPKKRRKRDKAARDPDDEKCARWLFKVLQKTAPKAREPNYATWADDVRLMRERDDRTHKEICTLFRWAHKDHFWCANILSPATLRKNWDRLAIQCAKAAEPKRQGGNWWATDETILAKGRELGIAPRSGEYMGQFKARIEAMLDPGNEPKVSAAPAVLPPPASAPSEPRAMVDQPDHRAQKPEGIGALKDLVRKVVLPARAA